MDNVKRVIRDGGQSPDIQIALARLHDALGSYERTVGRFADITCVDGEPADDAASETLFVQLTRGMLGEVVALVAQANDGRVIDEWGREVRPSRALHGPASALWAAAAVRPEEALPVLPGSYWGDGEEV